MAKAVKQVDPILRAGAGAAGQVAAVQIVAANRSRRYQPSAHVKADICILNIIPELTQFRNLPHGAQLKTSQFH